MESFQLPVALLVTLCVSLTALAFTVSSSEIWVNSRLIDNSPDPAVTTLCDRLVMRYLNSDNPSFDELLMKIRGFSGSSALGITLTAVDRAMEYGDMFRRDRLHKLRGRTLERMGRFTEAAESFRASLRWDSDNVETRKLLIKTYLKSGSRDLAKVEIRKILDHQENSTDTGYYQQLQAKLESTS